VPASLKEKGGGGYKEIDTMVADLSLANKEHQESFVFSSSLSLVNSSFMKGNQLTRKGAACRGCHSLPWELGETFCPISSQLAW
jgi:hypothetical protein